MSAAGAPPLVSIGMPVHNEARFIAGSIESLLAQDYPAFSLHVSDNASTDDTQDIVRRYADADPRVRYERLPVNVGAAENFRRVAAAADGEYFMWAAGHDRWSPNLLSSCVALLETHPRAAIAFASSAWIDADGEPLARESGWTDTRGMGAIERYFTVLWGNMHPVLGVIRRAWLARAGEVRSTVGADLILLTELALMGDFVHATAASWARREFRGEADYADKLRRYRSREYGLARGSLFPLARLPLELLRAVLRAELGWLDKACIAGLLLLSFPVRYLAARRR